MTGKRSDEYMTPAWVFDALGLTFDLDVASPPQTTHVPAQRRFTQAVNGLVQSWEGRVWMNPPFSNVTPWVDRFIEHANGVALLPTTKSNWLIRLWESPAAIAFPFEILRRWASVPDGADPQISYMVFFAAFGDECVEALANLGRVR